jgi:hypothetical protein
MRLPPTGSIAQITLSDTLLQQTQYIPSACTHSVPPYVSAYFSTWTEITVKPVLLELKSPVSERSPSDLFLHFEQAHINEMHCIRKVFAFSVTNRLLGNIGGATGDSARDIEADIEINTRTQTTPMKSLKILL